MALVSLPLFAAGLLVCWLWHRILTQYRALIGWRYMRLREMEKMLPDNYRMFTREWDNVYKPRNGKPGFNFSDREQQLPRIFMALLLPLAGWIGWI